MMATAAHATVAYSDFGLNNSFDTSNGWVISGPNSGWGAEFDPAVTFTSGASGKLTTIDVALGSYTPFGPAGTTFSLFTDNGGTSPGTILETFSSVTPTTDFGGSGDIFTLTSTGNVNLVAGQNYWLGASATTQDGMNVWYFNDQGATSVLFETGGPFTGDNGVNPSGAFDVNVAPVPEASTVVTFMLLMVGGGLVLLRRRSAQSAE